MRLTGLWRAAVGAMLWWVAAAQGVEAPAAGAAPSPPSLPMTEIAPGVWAHQGVQEELNPANRGGIANVGFVIGTRCVAVIDTGGSLGFGQSLLAAVRQRTQRPICHVINTHMHPDHVLGNAAFKSPGVSFVGHAKLRAALANRADTYLNNAAREMGAVAQGSEIVLPDVAVSGEQRLDLGGRTLVLRARPTAHTDNDLSVFDEASGTLWLGDLLFVGRIPVIDGNLKGWLALCRELRSLQPRHIIPGHGAWTGAWPQAIDTQIAYLSAVEQEVRGAIKAGKTLAETLDSTPNPQQSQWQLYPFFHRRNLTAAYAELEWE